MFGIKELASRVNLSVQTTRKRALKNKIGKKIGKTLVFIDSDIQKILDSAQPTGRPSKNKPPKTITIPAKLIPWAKNLIYSCYPKCHEDCKFFVLCSQVCPNMKKKPNGLG